MDKDMNIGGTVSEDKEEGSFDVFKALLDENFGINVLKENLDVKDLSRFIKLDGQDLSALSQLFGYIPGFIKDQIQNKNIAETMKNVYRIIIPADYSLAKSHTMEGAKKALILDRGGNSRGPADVIKIDGTDVALKGPQIAYSVFTALSFVTGQYFMRQLNDSLSQLNDRVDSIMAFLEEDKISGIQASIDELAEITNKLSYTKGNDTKVIATLNRIHHIQSVARRNMHFYSIQIEKSINEMSSEKKDDNETLDIRINDMCRNLEYYKLCLDIYGQAKVAEVGIQTMTCQEMLAYQKDIDVNIERFRTVFQRADHIRGEYLNKSLKQRAFKDGMAIGATAAGLGGMMLLGAGGAVLLNKISDDLRNRNEKMKDIFNQSKESTKSINSDLDKIESYDRIIAEWIEMAGKPMEIINVDDEFYIRISETEAEKDLQKDCM